jgi:hypothetical protein
MIDDHPRTPLNLDYAASIGLAIYCFASLEWTAVSICDRIRPGSIDELEDRTAGRVADTLLHLVRTLEQSPKQRDLQSVAEDFKFLVGTRNNLVHAKPGITTDGEQRLFRHGDQWTMEELEGVADAFARCSDRLTSATQRLRPEG